MEQEAFYKEQRELIWKAIQEGREAQGLLNDPTMRDVFVDQFAAALNTFTKVDLSDDTKLRLCSLAVRQLKALYNTLHERVLRAEMETQQLDELNRVEETARRMAEGAFPDGY